MQTENPTVGGSIPPLGTILFHKKSYSYGDIAPVLELSIFAQVVILGARSACMKIANRAMSGR